MSNGGVQELPQVEEYQKDRKEIEARLEDLEDRLKKVEAKLKQMDSSYNTYPQEDDIM